jgi:hypothetical protein
VTAIIAIIAGMVATAVAYLLGRRKSPAPPPTAEAPHEAIKRLDSALDDVRATPVDELARQLAERARQRERAIGGDKAVRD